MARCEVRWEVRCLETQANLKVDKSTILMSLSCCVCAVMLMMMRMIVDGLRDARLEVL